VSTQEEELRKLVNGSGFLFQLRVEHEIRKPQRSHRWEVISHEHAWQDPESGTEGFIDLILGNGDDNQRLVIECKRPRDASWVFLVSEDFPRDITRARCQWAFWTPQTQSRAGLFEFRVSPPSPEAEFCIVRGSGEGEKGMLERIAGTLLTSIEALIAEELALAVRRQYSPPRIYYPLIVTTAQLEICRFNREDISLVEGTLPTGNFERVPFIRFRKSLTTKLSPNTSPRDLTQANQDKERTVFIVNATELGNVLTQWRFTKEDRFESFPWSILWKSP